MPEYVYIYINEQTESHLYNLFFHRTLDSQSFRGRTSAAEREVPEANIFRGGENVKPYKIGQILGVIGTNCTLLGGETPVEENMHVISKEIAVSQGDL